MQKHKPFLFRLNIKDHCYIYSSSKSYKYFLIYKESDFAQLNASIIPQHNFKPYL